MEKFAGYGFNKSHAAAYALLSYHTAYLKAHHPAAFMAANLSLAMDDTDKIKILVEDAIDICGLTLLPPDINQSDYRFMPVGEPPSVTKQEGHGNPLRPGRGQGLGPGRDRSHRRGAPATARSPTCSTSASGSTSKQINRRTIESLIRAGAFDCFERRPRASCWPRSASRWKCADQAAAVGQPGQPVRRRRQRPGGAARVREGARRGPTSRS